MARLPKLGASFGRASILPDDGRSNRTAGPLIPQEDRFALVGNADRRKSSRQCRTMVQGQARGLQDTDPDLLAIMLHPAGTRVVLREFGIPARFDNTLWIDEEHRRAGGPLIDGHHQ